MRSNACSPPPESPHNLNLTIYNFTFSITSPPLCLSASPPPTPHRPPAKPLFANPFAARFRCGLSIESSTRF
ncbi:hypothetical protein RB9346 [Rhodopirellula baltica SH 1]|uniref:Uncharacterized protein n=1 Tax=Rhodopirellula baltica (strain DSM 10527 / NCIMB 13988 / SH1) TaxID=243090 RepID=Q7ULR0_RHOBA|nr:hypothetical protein RB9346 [Rhodopirellula baltica SH 1]